MSIHTRAVRVGDVTIGGGSPVVVQSMTNTKTHDVISTVEQIRELYLSGADLVRVAVPDRSALEAFREIRRLIDRPLVADIHFDHTLAVDVIKAGVDKVRINPGNIGSWDNVTKIISIAKKCGAAIRIGVNAGSLEKDVLDKYGKPTAEALCESALRYEQRCLDEGYDKIVLSLKSSDVRETVEAYRLAASLSSSPLHLGVTEAGTPFTGSLKSAIGIGSLLIDDIGDTFRVSLTADPVEEIKVALRMCRILGLRNEGVVVISCPTCGRTHGNLIQLVEEFEKRITNIDKSITVAIMGCVVNGPGEARQADLGLALGKGKGIIFRRGEKVKTVSEEEYIDALLQEVESY